ncbi:hypothetical protein L3X38_035169 [Prunus dulcis]|uniref:NAD(P)-binding domain-containing protein n=1 Tax=Prunus dulcis TaxID=3755 RepID=A0AAD4YYK1_PRUDU|nr:hypothetical protein L3X38_035169 [Prunus dulcis]
MQSVTGWGGGMVMRWILGAEEAAAQCTTFDPSNIVSLQLMFSKFEFDGTLNPTFVEWEFKLPLSSIRAYLKEPITPRFVHEFDFILTFKLKGEDLIWESGIPYTIVRPCALTEELAGADRIFDQGDNITGKISREEVAQICVAAMESPYASGKTFEVTARLMSLNCVLWL